MEGGALISVPPAKNKPYLIGLTGGIATGKSTVSTFLRELGAYFIDADEIAREIVLPGREAWQEVIQYFGPEILMPDGNINRKKLGETIFACPEAREALNRFTHPRVVAKIWEEIETLTSQAHPPEIIVIDMPLLFEIGFDQYVNETWVVAVEKKTQLARLCARDHLSREEAQKRLEAQMPLCAKIKRAHRVIDNTKDVATTRKQVQRYWEETRAKIKANV